jgi:hypothetical protein
MLRYAFSRRPSDQIAGLQKLRRSVRLCEGYGGIRRAAAVPQGVYGRLMASKAIGDATDHLHVTETGMPGSS